MLDGLTAAVGMEDVESFAGIHWSLEGHASSSKERVRQNKAGGNGDVEDQEAAEALQ